MAKSKAKNKKEEDRTSKWYELFKNLTSSQGFTLCWNPLTQRLDLKNPENKIVYSDVNVSSCKNIAAERYNILEKDWSLLK